VEEEADETALWLELVLADGILPERKVAPLLNEANELVAIAAASSISASRNTQSRGRKQSAIRNQKSAIKT
jgi:hypothetical protein